MKISDQNERDSGLSQGGQMTNLDLQKHMVFHTLNSSHNEVTFNEKSAITKEILHTKYFHSPTGGSHLSWIFWEHENLSGLSIIQLIQLL